MDELEELDIDNTDILKQNMVGRYIDRSNSQYKNWIYGIADHICFRKFVANYYLDYESKDENDVLGEEIKETSQGISETLPKSLPLMSFSEKLKLRKARQFLRHFLNFFSVLEFQYLHLFLYQLLT